jgi:putative flippase GtrA
MWNIQVLRFLLIGLLNTLFGYSVYAFFIIIGFHYALASLFSTILGVLFNFHTIRVYVFKNHNTQLLIRFIMVYGVVYLLNVTGLFILKAMSIGALIAGAILMLPLALGAYALHKYLVFENTHVH